VVNREIKRGFTFNILVMGETGVGKSTLMDSLFKRPLEDVTHTHDAKSVGCQVFTHDLEEGGVKLKLTIVHSTGFGDQLDRQQSPESLVGYIQTQFERYLQEELKTSRNLWRLHDSRIHACLYLLQPNGHSLKSLDLVTMRAIHDKVRSACDVLARPVVHNEGVVVILLTSQVNLIPVVAKADAITKAELLEFKQTVRNACVWGGVGGWMGQALTKLKTFCVSCACACTSACVCVCVRTHTHTCVFECMCVFTVLKSISQSSAHSYIFVAQCLAAEARVGGQSHRSVLPRRAQGLVGW
jgi:hypothetical protein